VRDLGDVLELLHTSPARWDSLRLSGTHWRSRSRYHDAWERSIAAKRSQGFRTSASVSATVIAEGDVPDEQVVPWRFWCAKPDKFRAEFQVGPETVRALVVGHEWWTWSRSSGLRTNHGDPSSIHGIGPADVLVDTPQLLSVLRIRGVSRTTFISRSAYVVSAEPASSERDTLSSVLHNLGPSADRYELIVDAAIGVLLRSQAEWRGESFLVLEVEQLAINEHFGEDLFGPDGLAS